MATAAHRGPALVGPHRLRRARPTLRFPATKLLTLFHGFAAGLRFFPVPPPGQGRDGATRARAA